jgi:hypothetical protein
MCWKVLDLLPHSFHVFGPLKKALKGLRFGPGKDIKAAVVQWFQQQPREFFIEGIHWLVRQYEACLSVHGDNF